MVAAAGCDADADADADADSGSDARLLIEAICAGDGRSGRWLISRA